MVFMVSAMLVRPTACLTDCMLTHSSDRLLLPLEGCPPNGMPNGLLVGSLIGLINGSPGVLIVSLFLPLIGCLPDGSYNGFLVTSLSGDSPDVLLSTRSSDRSMLNG